MSDPLRILACQIEIPPIVTITERDAHCAAVTERIRREVGDASIDLVVLPELSTVSYLRQSFERLDELAEPADGPSFERFSSLARELETTVVFGMPRRRSDGFAISQLAIGPGGDLIACYDKLHVAHMGLSEEKNYFKRGDHLSTFTCNGVQVGITICYDIRFPELFRALAWQENAQLILNCVAFARDETFASWHAFATARAMENQIYLLSLNQAGELYGSSIFCGPWVDEAHPPVILNRSAEDFSILSVDPAHLETVRQRYAYRVDRYDSYADLARSS